MVLIFNNLNIKLYKEKIIINLYYEEYRTHDKCRFNKTTL